MVTSAWAGHAGDAGGTVLFPPELLGILALLTILLTALLIVGLLALWLLVRIDRRLRTVQSESSLRR